MQNIKEFELEIGGINYLVQVSLDGEEIYKVEGVYIYDEEQRRYVDTNANTQEFYNCYEDYILEAYDGFLENRKFIAAEERYDALKEEGLI